MVCDSPHSGMALLLALCLSLGEKQHCTCLVVRIQTVLFPLFSLPPSLSPFNNPFPYLPVQSTFQYPLKGAGKVDLVGFRCYKFNKLQRGGRRAEREKNKKFATVARKAEGISYRQQEEEEEEKDSRNGNETRGNHFCILKNEKEFL